MRWTLILALLVWSSYTLAQNKLHDFAPVSGQSGSPVINVASGVVIISNVPTVVPSTTLRLPLNTVNYVYLDLTLGVVSVNQTGFTATQYPIAIATTDSFQIAILQDVRSGTTGGSSSGGVAPALPFGTLQFNNSGLLGATPGSQVNLSTGQVNVLNPAVGVATPGTAWYMNSFENDSYAEDFNWTQSPTSPASIVVGANTVTINAVRGINLFSGPPGIAAFGANYYTKHYLWLAGTGTAEGVLITNTNCVGASTGTCTVTFTAANTHAAGYTLASGTNGYQEALDDAVFNTYAYLFIQNSGGNAGGGIHIVGRPGDLVTFRTQFTVDSLNGGTMGPLVVDLNGGTIMCANPGQDCIQIGSHTTGLGTVQPNDVTIRDFQIIPILGYGRTANGTSIAIHDRGQNTFIEHGSFGFNRTNYFDTLISVDGDQNVDIGWIKMNVGNGPPMLCDTTWCGAEIVGTPLNSAANGRIHNSDLTAQCRGPMIDWQSGNGLEIDNNIFQNWPTFPWRYGGGLVDLTDNGHNYYEGTCTNPELGYVAGTGPQYFGNHVLMENSWSPGLGAAANFTQFSNTGTNVYTYYIVGINGAGAQTAPLMFGTASSNNTTQYTMKWPDFGATSYTVLRAGPLALDGTDTGPFGTGNWQVGSGITCAGVPHICSFTETFAAPASITVNPAWVPTIGTADQTLRYWPAPIFIGTGNANACVLYVGIAASSVNDCLFSGNSGNYYTAIYSGPGVSGSNAISVTGVQSMTLSRVWKGYNMESSSKTGVASTGAMIWPAAQASQILTGYKGVLNFATNWALASHDSDNITLYDSNVFKTLANGPSHQPLNDSNDCAIGFDVAPNYMAFRCQNAISFYVGQKFNSGTGRLFRVGIAGDEFGTHLNQVATGSVGGTCVFAASTTCTVTYGTAFTSTPVVILTPVNPGAVTFTLTSSSNTAFTITGSGSNSLTVNWMAIGNPN